MKLFQISNNKVTIINDEQFYSDTIKNYILDGGNVKKNDEKIISAVHDEQQRYCEINGKVLEYPVDFFENIINNVDILIAKKEKREYFAPSLGELKEAKIQQVRLWASNEIEKGLISLAAGSTVKYDIDKDAQLSILAAALSANTPLFVEKYQNGYPIYGYESKYADPQGNITWHSDKTIQFLSAEQILILCADLSIHINIYKQKEQEKIIEIENCKTEKELKTIVLK